jgi:acyl-CoA synthetase (AMP-forming)/AMP-acid ligase II
MKPLASSNPGHHLAHQDHTVDFMTTVPETLIDLLSHNAQAHTGAASVITAERILSHLDFFEAVRCQAAALCALGIQRGDRIVLLAGNRAEVLVLLGAAAWVGAILVPLNVRLSAGEIAQQAGDASPRLAIIDQACLPLWQASWPQGMPDVQTEVLDTGTGSELHMAGPVAASPVDRQDAPELGVLMLYTAAVEGHARGAVLAQSQLTASARQIGAVWSLGPHDRWLGVLPLFHAAGIGLSLALLAAGGACVLLPRFDPALAVAAIEQHRITVCATFAPMLGALLDAAQTTGAQLGSLRILTGLESANVLERLAIVCPWAGFWSAYGQAEVSSMVCLGLQREKPGAAGRAVPPLQVRVQNESGQPVGPGVQGEIAVCGPTVFLGYWDTQLQRPVKPADPWHRTGDLGQLDEDGWLWFTGRAPHKRLIKSGGENVYPAEVEQVLLEHDSMAEAFVFGESDEKWGEAVHAHCALKPGAHATADELIAWVGERLARYKRPQSVTFMVAPLQRSAPPRG